jgi:hypothetical protein
MTVIAYLLIGILIVEKLVKKFKKVRKHGVLLRHVREDMVRELVYLLAYLILGYAALMHI